MEETLHYSPLFLLPKIIITKIKNRHACQASRHAYGYRYMETFT